MKTTLTTLSIAALTAATFSLPAAAGNNAANAAKCGAKCSPANVVKHSSAGTSGSRATRQEVRAELERAYARGELGTQRNGEFVERPDFTGSKSSAQVNSELRQAFAQGNLGALRNGEFVASPAFEGSKSRTQVNAALGQAFERGNLGTQRNGEFTQFPVLASSAPHVEAGEEAIRAAQVTDERAAQSGS